MYKFNFSFSFVVLREKISELKETISNLQSKNQSLLAANENLLKESNKAKDNVTLKDYKRGENSLYSSPKNIKVIEII